MSVLDNPATRVLHNILIGSILFALVLVVLPVYALPSSIVLALAWFFETLWSFNWLFPVLTFLYCLEIAILTEVSFATLKFVLFLKRHYTSDR